MCRAHSLEEFVALRQFQQKRAACVGELVPALQALSRNFSSTTYLIIPKRLSPEAETVLNKQLSILEGKLKDEFRELQRLYSNIVTKETIRRHSPVPVGNDLNIKANDAPLGGAENVTQVQAQSPLSSSR